MSNLGYYQTMTTCAKKVGGPVKLFVLSLAVGGAVSIPCWELGKKLVKSIKRKSFSHNLDNKLYTVHKNSIDGQGLRFKINDRFTVLEKDGNTVLIAFEQNNDNPSISLICECTFAFDCKTPYSHSSERRYKGTVSGGGVYVRTCQPQLTRSYRAKKRGILLYLKAKAAPTVPPL